MVAGRDENGRFAKGNSGGPGRMPREKESRYYDLLISSVSLDDWQAIVRKAVAQAKAGNPVARKWLADYILGTPVQRLETSGPNGGPIESVVIYLPDNGRGNGTEAAGG